MGEVQNGKCRCGVKTGSFGKIDTSETLPILPFMLTHKLSPLPYAYNALEPHIDAKTMEIHYTKHHQAYVDNLNKALQDPSMAPMADMEIEELLYNMARVPAPMQNAVRNNAGGHFNHTFFWHTLTPKQISNVPVGHSAKAINTIFGSFDKFKEEFTKAALTRFGSGWAWLVINYQNELQVTQTAYQDNPLMDGLVTNPGLPILGIDVWEHAYYLNYQNRRADYVKAFWNIVSWEQVEAYYQMAMQAAMGSNEGGGCCGGGKSGGCGCK